jgi:putative serine protease PepD
MLRKRTTSIVAAVALVAGAAAGAGTYAAFDGNSGKTTTVVEPATRNASPAAATSTLGVNAVYERARDGVVEITTTSNRGGSDAFPFPGGGDQPSRAQGSGFVYDRDGHVLTNYHVIASADAISVTFADGSKYSAKVVGSDQSSDLALLKVDAPSSKLHPLALGDSSNLEVGDGVVAIGSPFGLEETVTTGIVSALGRNISSTNNFTITGAIQTDAAINHGNSGGPLLNMAGNVIGVNTQIESESGGNDGVGFAVPANTVRGVAERLVKGQKVVHPYLGVSVGDALARAGARLGTVRSGSPAAAAGLKAGDVITAFGDQKVTSAEDLTTAVAAKQAGDKVKVTFVRGGDTKTVEVTVGTRPS